jgi:deoxycytidine triphosphate deaminase
MVDAWTRINAGSLIGADQLSQVLAQEDNTLFMKGTCSPHQIKGAGYDLRLSGDMWIQPRTPGGRLIETRPDLDLDEAESAHQRREITLKPGDSAVVTTIERFSLDFDASALIGPKFSQAARGLVLFHGMAAHPGYGRKKDDVRGTWEVTGEPLYLVVANAGPFSVILHDGDEIAYVQFFKVAGVVPPKTVANTGWLTLQKLFGGGQGADGALLYFRQAADVAARVDELEKKLNAQVMEVETTVDRAKESMNTVVLFGVFLVAATLLGLALSMSLDAINSLPDQLHGWKVGAVIGVASALAVVLVVLVVLAFLALRAPRRPKASSGAPGFDPAKETTSQQEQSVSPTAPSTPTEETPPAE